MTLVDPTGGVGYSFGQILPATHMTTIAANQPKAVDGNGGGTWSPAAPIILSGASALQLGGKLKYTSRSVLREQPLVVAARTSLNNWQWAPSGGPNGTYEWRHANTLGSTTQHELTNLGHNSVLDTLFVWFIGPSHGGMWPVGSLPVYTLIRVYRDGTEAVIGAPTTDTSASQAEYEAAHATAITTVSGHVVDTQRFKYFLVVTAENGANAVVGARYLGCEVQADVTEQAEV